MRKLTNKSEEAKKRKRNQFIVGGILVLLMLLSTVGYAFQGTSNSSSSADVMYNGFKFVPQSGLWNLQIGNSIFRFSYNPTQVGDFPGEVNLLNSYAGKPLYISSKDFSSENEIYMNFDQVVLRRQYACLEEECDGNLPIKTCEDNFIIIKEANQSEIKQDNNCVFISAPKEELVQTTDAFIFKTLGVK